MRDPWRIIEQIIDRGSKVALVGAVVTIPILMLLHWFGIHN